MSIGFIELLFIHLSDFGYIFLQTFDELKTSLENMKKFQMQNDTNVKQNIHGRKQGDAIYCPIAEILASVYGVIILLCISNENVLIVNAFTYLGQDKLDCQ